MSGPPTRRRNVAAFVSMLVIFVLIGVATIAATEHVERYVQAHVGAIVDDALASVRLVGRMLLDEEKQLTLLEVHVQSKSPARMRDLEERMAAIEADYTSAAREYQRLATYPGESDAWLLLQRDHIGLQQEIPEVLRLSQTNDDHQAQAKLDALETLHDAVGRDGQALSDLNVLAAAKSAATIESLHRSLYAQLLLLGSVGLAAMIGLVALLTRFLKQLTLDARRALELEMRNRELDAFAGRVAHDLRDPLAVLKLGSAQLTERAPAEQSIAGLLQRGVSRMEVLLNDLLSLSRIDTYAEAERCDPSLIIAELVEGLRPRLDAEGGALQVQVVPSEVACSGELLRQALLNLVDNALKYHRAEAPPRIEIVGEVVGDGYSLSVSDHGLGLSVEESEQVFQPLFRGASPRAQTGTGLGLSIVKRVIEANGGTVSMRSQVGQGTTFLLSLPLVLARSESLPTRQRRWRRRDRRAAPA